MGAPPLRLGLCGLLLLAFTPLSHPADGPHPSHSPAPQHLRWFSAYDVPAAQCANVSGWMNLHQGDSAEEATLCAKHGVRTLWSVEKLFFNSSVLGHKGCAKVPGGCLVRDWRQAWEKLLPVVAPLVADKTIAVSAAAPSASSEALRSCCIRASTSATSSSATPCPTAISALLPTLSAAPSRTRSSGGTSAATPWPSPRTPRGRARPRSQLPSAGCQSTSPVSAGCPRADTSNPHPHPCARRRVCDASKRQGAAMEP